MILDFSITNFKSIRDKEHFSMLPERNVKEHRNSILRDEKYQALSCAMVYGRNASGKSNLISALYAFQELVMQSASLAVGAGIPVYEPFMLDRESVNYPTTFEITFLAKNRTKYIYHVSFNGEHIVKEALYFFPKNQVAKLFERQSGNKISYGEYFLGRRKGLEDSLYDNQLLLSKVRTEKIEILLDPYMFFSDQLFVSNIHDTSFDNLLLEFYSNKIGSKKDEYFFQNMSTLLKSADTGIDSLSISESEFNESSLPKEMSPEEKRRLTERYKYKLRTIRNEFKNGKTVGKVEFTLAEESTGTLKLLIVGGLIIEALASGQTLVIDELDKSLHPKLTRSLIQIFLNEKTNPHKAQLIFATHDVSLLDLNLFRRDQIWFVEKEFDGCSTFYSLSNVSGIRKNIPLEKWYMHGRLGGTPVINQNELKFEF